LNVIDERKETEEGSKQTNEQTAARGKPLRGKRSMGIGNRRGGGEISMEKGGERCSGYWLAADDILKRDTQVFGANVEDRAADQEKKREWSEASNGGEKDDKEKARERREKPKRKQIEKRKGGRAEWWRRREKHGAQTAADDILKWDT
jgi:hypothetical protein